MTYTPEQLTSLNRAIAKHAGYDYDKEFFDWQHLSGVGGAAFHLNYTTSLDAIVEVVREWYGNGKNRHWFMEYLHGGDAYASLADMYLINDWQTFTARNKSLAIALCLAFAKAVGLKGEWDE